MSCINNYLNEVLTYQLKEFGVSDVICDRITDNINLQMLFLLEYWNDDKFRNTILNIGLEEGEFYQPKARIEVKCFVVVTIRNSLLETLASDAYKCLSATRALSDDEVKLITSKAIGYYSEIDLKALSKSLNFEKISNIYKKVKETYPVAWKAMEALGNTKKKCLRFSKVNADVDKELIHILNQQEDSPNTKLNSVVLSGYDENLDEILINKLKQAYSVPDFVFFSNSFKMISRNINKLFRILNFLLQCDAIVVMSNYYITNGYIEIRKPLIKPAHTTAQLYNDLQNIKGLSAKHADVIKHISKESYFN